MRYSLECTLANIPAIGNDYFKTQTSEFLNDIPEDFSLRLLAVFNLPLQKILRIFTARSQKLTWWLIKSLFYENRAITIGRPDLALKSWGKTVGAAIRLLYLGFSRSTHLNDGAAKNIKNLK